MFAQLQIIIRHNRFTIHNHALPSSVRQPALTRENERSRSRSCTTEKPLHKSNYFIVDGTLLCYCDTHHSDFLCCLLFPSLRPNNNPWNSVKVKSTATVKSLCNFFSSRPLNMPIWRHWALFFSKRKWTEVEKSSEKNWLLSIVNIIKILTMSEYFWDLKIKMEKNSLLFIHGPKTNIFEPIEWMKTFLSKKHAILKWIKEILQKIW